MKSNLINLGIGCMLGLFTTITCYIICTLADFPATVKFIALLFIMSSLFFTEIMNIVDHFKFKK